MKTYGTYFQNDKDLPIKYGEINLINPERQRLRGEPLYKGVEVYPVFQGFCGTDFELMKMGKIVIRQESTFADIIITSAHYYRKEV